MIAFVIDKEVLNVVCFSKWIDNWRSIFQKMVGLPGLEPGTSPLSGVHSNQLSYRPS